MVEKRKPNESSEKKDLLDTHNDIVDLRKQIIWPKLNEIVSEAMSFTPLLNFWSLANLLNKQKAIVDYIFDWKLKSGEDFQLEKHIEKLSNHPMAWKLKFLCDNSKSPLEIVLSEIDEREKKIRAENVKRIEKLQKQSEQLNG